MLQEKEYKMNKKLHAHNTNHQERKGVDRKVVVNLSSRVLANEETDCLANGLDFGLVPRRVDDMDIITNVEQFFHHVTGIYEHHKPLVSELQ